MLRIFFRHGMDPLEGGHHFVQSGFALGFGGFHHQIFRHNEGEVHGGGMDALVQHGLGDVGGGDALFLVHLIQGDDELVHTMALGGDVIGVRQLVHHIVGIEHRITGSLGDALLAQGEHIGEGPDYHQEVAVKGLHPADGLRQIVVHGVPVLPGHRMRLGQVGGQQFLTAYGSAARSAAAMGGGEGFVQVEMHHIKAHIAGAYLAHDGVEVGAVIIAKAAGVLDDLGDLQNVLIENTQSVGVGQHQAGGVFAHRLLHWKAH